MSSYLKNVPNIRTATAKELDEMPEEEVKPARRARGTSPYVQVKVRRDIYETLGAVAKANSMSTSEIVENILESHTESAKEALNSLKIHRKS